MKIAACALSVISALAFLAPLAAHADDGDARGAKETAVRLPSGRRTYDETETFGEALDITDRMAVIEIALGLAAEGHFAVGLGVLFPWIDGLEVHGAIGFELNPAVHYSATIRQTIELGSVSPYLLVGFSLSDLWAQGTMSAHAFAELGFQFRIHTTYRVWVGGGADYTLRAWAKGNSPLLDGTTDPAWVERELRAARAFAPVVSVRFSRAF